MPFKPFHKIAFIVAIILYGIVAWVGTGYYHADEQFQIIEFAGLKLGFNEATDLAWEYEAGIRPALQPAIAYVAVKILNIFTENPYLQAFLLRLLTGLMALIAIRRFILATESKFHGKYKKLYVLTSYFLWFLPLIFTRFSSEAWSGILLILAISEIIKHPKINTKSFIKIGCLLGFAFLFRYQSAFVSIGLLGWLIFIQKERIITLLKTICVILSCVALGILVDSWFYEEFIVTAWNYFDYNIIQDVASTFGTKHFLWYFYAIIKYTFLPIGVLIGLAFLYALIERPKSIYLWGFLPLFIVHSLIPHKEIRFLFPVIFLVAPILTHFVSSVLINLSTLYKPQWKVIPIATITITIIAIATNVIGIVAITSKTAGESLVHTGQYIYRNYNESGATLYQTYHGKPYAPFKIPLNFYRQNNITTIGIDSICHFQDDFKLPDSAALVSFSAKDRPNFSCFENHPNLKFTKLTQSWPDWLEKLNTFYPMYEDSEQAYLYKIESKR